MYQHHSNTPSIAIIYISTHVTPVGTSKKKTKRVELSMSAEIVEYLTPLYEKWVNKV
jgi:hypothetical protein